MIQVKHQQSHLGGVDRVGDCHELARRDGLEQPPAPENMERSGPTPGYLDAVVEGENLPAIVPSDPAGFRRRQQLLDAALTGVRDVPSERVLADGPFGEKPREVRADEENGPATKVAGRSYQERVQAADAAEVIL